LPAVTLGNSAKVDAPSRWGTRYLPRLAKSGGLIVIGDPGDGGVPGVFHNIC
jgi:hypothetical protein